MLSPVGIGGAGGYIGSLYLTVGRGYKDWLGRVGGAVPGNATTGGCDGCAITPIEPGGGN